MPVATLTSKGQLVIPEEIREYLHLQPGDRLDFLIGDDGDVIIRPAVTDVRELKGLLHKPGRPPVAPGKGPGRGPEPGREPGP